MKSAKITESIPWNARNQQKSDQCVEKLLDEAKSAKKNIGKNNKERKNRGLANRWIRVGQNLNKNKLKPEDDTIRKK